MRRVFQEYVSGKGFSSICSGLNGDGVLSRFGKAWDVSVIKNMVANHAYIGVMEYGKHKYNRKGRKPGQKQREDRDKTSPNYHYKEGVYPAIIDQATWDMAQSLREVRKQATNPRHLNGTFLLSGIATCSHCGYPLAGRTLRQKDRSKVRREYRCSSMAHNKGACDAGTIEAEGLEDLVYHLLKEQINMGVMQDVIAQAREARGARIEQLRQALADTQNAVAKTKKSQARMRAAFLGADEEPDEDTVAAFKDEMAQLFHQQKALAAKEKEIQAKLQEAEEGELPTAWVEDVAAKLDAWGALDPEQRKSVLRVAVKSFTVYRKKYVNQVKGAGRRNPHPVEFLLVTRLEDMGMTDQTIPLLDQGA